MIGIALAVLAAASALAPAAAPGEPARDAALGRVLARTLGPEAAAARAAGGSRARFEQAVGGGAFLHEAVGPFDLYVYVAGDLGPDGDPPFDWASGARRKSGRKARAKDADAPAPAPAAPYAEHALEGAAVALQALVPIVERHLAAGAEAGVVSGTRFPVVLCSDAERATGAFDELIALLDWADADWTGFTRDNGTLWTDELRDGVVVRNWEAQVINLAHPSIVDRGDEFLEHGLGYYTLAHLVRRLLVFGGHGNPPPWFSDGLVDELDIEAFGQAWVGGDWWTKQTAGWYRPGWSGFLPTGVRPPPVVKGPPADLAVTVSQSGDSWQHRANSATRHWTDLHNDLDSEAPASFAFMAENESFLPRDRALARAALHTLLELAPPEQGPSLLAAFDRPRRVGDDGMPDSDPLPVIFARQLGGVAEVDELESISSRELLQRVGQGELIGQIERLGAAGMLELSDHREQSRWLYGQYDFGPEPRNAIWQAILAIEYWQQLEEWKAVGRALDRAMGAALGASKKYPSGSSQREKVAEAFRGALPSS